MRFAAGTTVAMREVWRGQIWAARPMTVVRDDDLHAFWLPRGTEWKRPVTLAGERLRVPTERWRLTDATWARFDVLHLVEPGAAHAVWLSWSPDGSFYGWYVNVQEPLRRTAIGFDYMDLALDVVVSPDFKEWRWKDEEDLAEYVAHGLLTPDEAAAVRAEGERVLERIHADATPFCDGWERWRADPSWALPVLPAGWDVL